jgi:hypothetical protein
VQQSAIKARTEFGGERAKAARLEGELAAAEASRKEMMAALMATEQAKMTAVAQLEAQVGGCWGC